MNILLMTATINPGGMINSSITNAREREAQYISTLRFYASISSVHKIVFVENSGSNLGALKKALTGFEEKIEWISLDANNYPKEYGKGYGEFRLIDIAVDKAVSLKEPGCCFIKVTGRFPLLNIEALLKEFDKKHVDLYCDIVDHNLYDWLGLRWNAHHGRTVVYKVGVDFYRGNFYGRYKECDDRIGHDAEWLMFQIYKQNIDNPKVIKRFKIEPIPVGRAGHHASALLDTNNYDSILYKSKRFIRQLIRWIAPSIWF